MVDTQKVKAQELEKVRHEMGLQAKETAYFKEENKWVAKIVTLFIIGRGEVMLGSKTVYESNCRFFQESGWISKSIETVPYSFLNFLYDIMIWGILHEIYVNSSISFSHWSVKNI